MSDQRPIELADFWQKLRLRSIIFDLPDEQSGTGTGRGEVLRASRGDLLWHGTARVGLNRHDAQDQVKALMDEVRHGGSRFLVCDPKRRAPQFDPDGMAQGSSTAKIAAVDSSDRRRLVLAGLPVGFALRPGDLVSIEYGDNPVRFFLARIQRGGRFSTDAIPGLLGGGVSRCDLRVLPFLPLGLRVGQEVRLRDPVCKASYVPDSYTPVERMPGYDSGFEFKWRQTYR
jgi:hypothetical protein